jgi:hypothetical protein
MLIPQMQYAQKVAGGAMVDSPHAQTFARRHGVAHAFLPLAKSRLQGVWVSRQVLWLRACLCRT